MFFGRVEVELTLFLFYFSLQPTMNAQQWVSNRLSLLEVSIEKNRKPVGMEIIRRIISIFYCILFYWGKFKSVIKTSHKYICNGPLI